MDLPPLDQEEFTKWKESNINVPIIKESDMLQDMREEVQELLVTCMERCTGSEGTDIQAAGKLIKESMDRRYSPAWHCIIGEGFAYEVSRQLNSTILMYYKGTHSILLFKC